MTAVAIEAVRADITTLDVDAVVNAANSRLRPGAGVSGAIFRRAGLRLVDACEAIGGCDTGNAVATPGFDLPARWVIHAVGPVWQGGAAGEADLLASCYRRSLEVADELGARSIAFPAISTGIYSYPPDDAAVVAVRTARSTAAELTVIEQVLLVAFDTTTFDRYVELLSSPDAP
jgi:O-acetyl-ADP-ribose deacetylase